jgi:hypothetical protein
MSTAIGPSKVKRVTARDPPPDVFESRFVGKLTFKGGYPTDETGQAALLDMPGVERVSTARQIGRG